MNQSLDIFCHAIKTRYPEIAAKADAEHERRWGNSVELEHYSYSWFETLANTLNREMCRGTPASEYRKLLLDISTEFRTGMDDVRQCIDVAFVENLFWQVPPDKALAYWTGLPENLQSLYIDFHRKTPI